MSADTENGGSAVREYSRRLHVALQGRMHHVHNVLSFLGLRALALVTFAIAVPTFIRNTSAKEYGLVAIGFSLLGFTSLLEVGIGYVITQSAGRRLARSGDVYPRMLARLFWFYFVAAVSIAVAMAITVAMLPSLTSSQRTLYLWLTALIPFLAISGTVAAVYQANNDLVYLNSSRFLFEFGKGLALAVSGHFLHGSGGIGPIVLVMAMARALRDLAAVKRRYGYAPTFPRKIVTKRAISAVTLGLPVIGCAALFLSVTISDKILIAHFLGPSEVARYALAADISTKAYLLVHATNSSIYALILGQHAVRQDVARFVRVSLLSVGVVALFFYLPFAWNAAALIGWWINPVMGRDAATIAQFMAASAVVYLIGNAFENALLAMGKARVVFLSYACSVTTFFVSILAQKGNLSLTSFGISYLLMSLVYAGAVFSWYQHARVGAGRRWPQQIAGLSTVETS